MPPGVFKCSFRALRQQAWTPALTRSRHLLPQGSFSTSKGATRPVALLRQHLTRAWTSADLEKATSAPRAIWEERLGFHWGKPRDGGCKLSLLPKKGNYRPVLAQAQRNVHIMAATGGQQDSNGRSKQPVALLSCGSFNPPTVMHLRMFDLARFALEEIGHQVVGAYMSPVNDAYKKANLVAGKHRVAMSHLAAEQLPYLEADGWEAEQAEYQPTLNVLKHFSRQHPGMQQSSTEAARVMLLAGADLLETFLEPGIWAEEDQEAILRDYGVVCITRATTAVEELLSRPGTSLSRHRQNIHIVHEPITNDISATKIRKELALGHPVRFLVPDSVADYIKTHSLYSSPDLEK